MLEPGQLELLERYRKRWAELGLSTEPADRPRAEAALAAMYLAGGLPPPRVHWASSPPDLLAQAQELEGKPVWHAVGASVGDLTWRAIWDQLEATKTSSVWESLGGIAHHHLSADNNGMPWSRQQPHPGLPSAEASVSESREQFVAGETLQAWFCRRARRGHGRTGEYWWDADWIGDVLPVFAFSRQVLGLDAPPGLDALIALTESAGPWIALERDVVVCERPTLLRLDKRGRLHSRRGPAIAWPDGRAIYALEGQPFHDFVIERPQELKPRHIQGERNLERRRLLLEQFGVERFIREAEAKLLSEDECGRLWQAQFGWLWEEPLFMVEVTNSTLEMDGSRRSYWLRVPPGMRTAREAVAWTFGLWANDYRPDRQT